MSSKLSLIVPNLSRYCSKHTVTINARRLLSNKLTSTKKIDDWNLVNNSKLINLNKPQFYKRIQEIPFENKCIEDKEKVLMFLSQKLKCKTQNELEQCIKNNSNLLQINIENSQENINILEALDLVDYIPLNSWLLLLPSSHLDKLKEILIQKANLSFNIYFTPQMIPLLSIPILKFKQYLNKIYSEPIYSECSNIMSEINERINYLVQELKISRDYLLSIFLNHPVLISSDFKVLKSKMELLKNTGLTSASLLNDLWVFNHDYNLMKARIDQANKCKFSIKTWMLRCEEQVFQSQLENWKDKVSILGENNTKASYFAQKLGVDIKLLEEANERDRVLTVSITKLEIMINFLLEQGFKGNDIVKNARILTFGFPTVKKRIMELKALSNERISLHNIIKTPRDYGEYYRKRRDRSKYHLNAN